MREGANEATPNYDRCTKLNAYVVTCFVLAFSKPVLPCTRQTGRICSKRAYELAQHEKFRSGLSFELQEALQCWTLRSSGLQRERISQTDVER